jgi:hypothetical protein
VKGNRGSESPRSSPRVDLGGLRSPADLVRWHMSLVPLAVRRSIPVMAMAGVPLAMAERPIGVLGWARSMLRQIDAQERRGTVTFVEGGGWIDDRTMSAVALILERGFDRLAGVYGSGNAFDLAGWLARNEADWTQSEEWRAWHMWLVSAAFGRIELPLSRPSQAVVTTIIDAGLGRESEALCERCEQQALGVPLSSAEQTLLKHDVGADEEPSSQDVLASMGLARGRELARAIVSVLRMTLANEEWETVATAARPRPDRSVH